MPSEDIYRAISYEFGMESKLRETDTKNTLQAFNLLVGFFLLHYLLFTLHLSKLRQ